MQQTPALSHVKGPAPKKAKKPKAATIPRSCAYIHVHVYIHIYHIYIYVHIYIYTCVVYTCTYLYRSWPVAVCLRAWTQWMMRKVSLIDLPRVRFGVESSIALPKALQVNTYHESQGRGSISII